VKPSKPTVNGHIPRSSQVTNTTVQNGLPEGCSHPAPLPDMPNPQPHSPSWKKIPQIPILKISRMEKGKYAVILFDLDIFHFKVRIDTSNAIF
jgi:hypothetical protein